MLTMVKKYQMKSLDQTKEIPCWRRLLPKSAYKAYRWKHVKLGFVHLALVLFQQGVWNSYVFKFILFYWRGRIFSAEVWFELRSADHLILAHTDVDKWEEEIPPKLPNYKVLRIRNLRVEILCKIPDVFT